MLRFFFFCGPGSALTRASFFCCVRWLIIDDFPTLERPTIAMCGLASTGRSESLVVLVKNAAGIIGGVSVAQKCYSVACMWNIFSQKSISSEKNGKIMVLSTFGKTDVFVGGFHQSSGYIQKMWRKALRHVPRSASIKTVLMLGLGGGSAVRELQNRFRGCAITVEPPPRNDCA